MPFRTATDVCQSHTVEWVKVYDLAEDAPKIEAAQRATLQHPSLGLKPEPALFGSAEWWSAVESGDLQAIGLLG